MSTTIIPGPNVFRAISGSLFSSPINWSRGYVPTGSDVADIRDNCVVDINRTVGSLVVQPGFTASINTGLTLRTNSVINVLGSISSSGTPTILSLASKNIVNNFQAGLSTFHYSGSTNQSVFGGTYYNLTVSNSGVKTLSSNIIVSGSLSMGLSSILELSNYDLEVSGAFSMNNSTVSKKGYGQLIFNGLFTLNGKIDFPGSPSIEFRNGIFYLYSPIATQNNFGSGNVIKFTTRDQTISGNTAIDLTSDILISGSNTLTIDSSMQWASFYGFINGSDPLSKIVSKTTLYFLTARSVERCMVTGTLDITSFNNTVAITGNHISTLSSTFNYFRNLDISNGLKTAGTNMFVSGNFNTNAFELGNYNLTVTGSSTIQYPGPLSKSGPGNITFIGNVNVSNAGSINFSAGNPTVELRGGITNTGNGGITSGTGSWNFTTNNQTINSNNNLTFNAPISIQNIAVTCSGNGGIILNRPINGTTVNSIIVNRAGITFATAASLTGSILTGSYDFNSSVNTIGIGGDYTAVIPARFSSSFYNLNISGLGTKSLATDIYISGALSIVGNFATVGGYFDISGSNLFVSGTTTGTNSTFVKSGPGKITFGGFASFINGNVINFTGHPTVEFQNGVFAHKNNAGSQYLGTGSYIFSTRNQTIALQNGDFGYSSVNKLIVSGAIAVTASSPFGVMINDIITGTDPASAFKLGPYTLYINTTSSIMPTGSLDLSDTGSAVGFVYDNASVSSYSIPYTNFSGSLVVGGQYTTKSLSGDTYIRGRLDGNIQFGGSIYGTLECGNYNLFVSGATGAPLGSGGALRFFKSGPGYVTFNGGVIFNNGSSISLTGNPTIETRNGLFWLLNNTGFWNLGSGSIIFSTAPTQTLYLSYNGSYTIQNPIIISGSVNLIYTGSTGIRHAGVFNGTDIDSKLTINNSQTVYYNNAQQPMLTGSIDFSSSLNTFVYNSGSQNVRGGVYRNLTFLNGLKTLQGNVSVLGTFSTGSGATSASINLNGFTLTNP